MLLQYLLYLLAHCSLGQQAMVAQPVVVGAEHDQVFRGVVAPLGTGRDVVYVRHGESAEGALVVESYHSGLPPSDDWAVGILPQPLASTLEPAVFRAVCPSEAAYPSGHCFEQSPAEIAGVVDAVIVTVPLVLECRPAMTVTAPRRTVTAFSCPFCYLLEVLSTAGALDQCSNLAAYAAHVVATDEVAAPFGFQAAAALACSHGVEYRFPVPSVQDIP